MADRLEEILGKRFNSLKELKEEIVRLQNSIVNLNTDSEEFIETNTKLIAAQEQYTAVSRAKVEVINAEDDSIVGLQKQYKILYNQYKVMSAKEREENSQMISDMAALSDRINQLKKDAGNFKDNIGRYSESIVDAFGKMGISMGALQAPLMLITKVFEDGGQSIIKNINTISENIKNLGDSITAGMGNTAKNITDAMSSMGDGIKSSMETAAKATQEGINNIGQGVSGLQGIAKNGVAAIKNLGTALKSFIAIPAVAVIAAIVVAFKAFQAIAQRVKEAINQNEESQMALKEAMANFQPVVDAVSNAFDHLGTIVVKVIGFVGNAFSKIREVGAGITDFLHITKGAQDRVKEQNKLYKETAKAENELVKTKREYLKLNADDEAEVQRLREEASETQNLEERKKLLTEAKEKQAEIDARNIEVAKQELAIIQEQASRTANDAAMNDKLAQALANVSKAEADAAKNAREFNQQINGGGGGGSALKNWREEAKKIYTETIQNSKTEIQVLTEKYKEEKKLLEKYHFDTTLLTKQYEKERSTIIATEFKRSADALSSASDRSIQGYKRLMEATQTKIQNLQDEIKRLEVYAPMRLHKIDDEFDAVCESLIETNSETWSEISDGIYQNINDVQNYQGIIDYLTAKISERAKNFPAESKRYEAAAKAVADMGEDGWLKLVEPIQKAIDAVQEWDNITITAMSDVETATKNVGKRAEEAKKELEEAFGEEAFGRLGKLEEGMSSFMYESIYSMLKYNEHDEGLFSGIDQFMAQAQRNQLEIEKKAYEEELANFKGTQEQKLEILAGYYERCNALRQQDAQLEATMNERGEEIRKSAFARFDAQMSNIANITSAYAALIQQQKNDSKITTAETKKKINTLKALEKVALAVNIAQIAASTAAGIMDVWKAYGTETASNAVAGFGNPIAIGILNGKSLTAAILKSAAIGATGTANIAAATMGTIGKIQSLNAELEGLNGSAGGTSAVANVQPIDSTPYTYTRTLQTQEEYDDLTNRPLWVSVSDIESGLGQRAKVVDESSF